MDLFNCLFVSFFSFQSNVICLLLLLGNVCFLFAFITATVSYSVNTSSLQTLLLRCCPVVVAVLFVCVCCVLYFQK